VLSRKTVPTENIKTGGPALVSFEAANAGAGESHAIYPLLNFYRSSEQGECHARHIEPDVHNMQRFISAFSLALSLLFCFLY
jgi:hypothetical protein